MEVQFDCTSFRFLFNTTFTRLFSIWHVFSVHCYYLDYINPQQGVIQRG